MALPRVDVGVVCWNTRDLTLDALDRLLAAADDVDLRVLVRDNGSTDGTADAVRARFDDVEVEAGDNVGFARGVNALLDRSDAPWFVTLNSDAWPEPGALRRMVDVAQEHPRTAAVAPTLLRPDGTNEPSAYDLPSVRGAVRSALRRPAPAAGPVVGWAVGAALLLRRSAVEEIGGLDPSLFMYAEDLDWCWRAARGGWEVRQAPDAVVRHVGNASGAQRWGERREAVAIGNANRVVRRHLGPVRGGAWQAVNALGAVRAGMTRDADRRRFWWRQVPAHLGAARH